MVPIVKGGTEGGGREEGSGVTNKVQREDWRMSDKPLRNLSTQNDYVASRVQVHLHRTQIKKKYIIIITRIKDRKMRETKPILPL